MLETTPSHWNGVVYVWIEGCTLALMQRNQREILGIASHALRNWHSGYSGLAAITRVGSGSGRSGEGRAALVTEWGGKSSSCKRMFLMNIRRPTHFYNFETAWGLPHWSWCLFPGLFKLVQEDLDPAVCYIITAVITTGWLCYTT